MNYKVINIIFKICYILGLILSIIGFIFYFYIKKQNWSFAFIIMGGTICLSYRFFNPQRNGDLDKNVMPRFLLVLFYLILLIGLIIVKS